MVMKTWKATLPLLIIAALFDYVELQPTGEVSEEQVNADRLSFLEWLVSIISPGSSTTEGEEPEPIDPSKCAPCKCGLTNKKIRIVGGVETQVNQYPWMAQLLYDGRFYCGGSLINSKYVLTASHCVKGFNQNKLVVRLLDHSRATTGEARTIDRKVQHIVTHSRYDDRTFNNDIALLGLDKAVPMKGLLRPVCLPIVGCETWSLALKDGLRWKVFGRLLTNIFGPKKEEGPVGFEALRDAALGKSFTGLQGVVTGWGVTTQHGAPSDVLKEVAVPIMSNKECRTTSYGQKKITDNMLCAGFPEGKKDSCQGDSGGPLHVTNGTVHSVVGVVSWGEGCGLPNHPGVYTRVNRYLTWIKRYTKDACFCE